MRGSEVAPGDATRVATWLEALERRYLADLRFPEVTRALRALSSAYVERRHAVARGATLDSAGKRAAFALYYAPLHFLTVHHIVRALGADTPPPSTILDIGCGTGVAGAAWAVAAGGTPRLLGVDRHPWAVAETRWTFAQLGLNGDAKQGDATRPPSVRTGMAIVAAYAINELPADARTRLEDTLISAAGRGARVLIVEPIARGITPWWNDAAARVVAAGGRADEWRIAEELPSITRRFADAAGLQQRELTARTLYCPAASRR